MIWYILYRLLKSVALKVTNMAFDATEKRSKVFDI